MMIIRTLPDSDVISSFFNSEIKKFMQQINSAALSIVNTFELNSLIESKKIKFKRIEQKKNKNKRVCFSLPSGIFTCLKNNRNKNNLKIE